MFGSMMISDLTELATRLYFCADFKARWIRASDRLRIFPAGRDADDRPEAQVGEYFRAVQFDQLGTFGAAFVGEQIQVYNVPLPR